MNDGTWHESTTGSEVALPRRASALGPGRLWGLVLACSALVACGSGRPSVGAVRITLVSRTNDTFVVNGSVNYVSSGSDDLVKEAQCIVFPEGALGPSAVVSNSTTELAGRATFPAPVQPAGVTNGAITFALQGTGKEGRYEVLCGAVSTKGLTSEVDVRTPIVVP